MARDAMLRSDLTPALMADIMHTRWQHQRSLDGIIIGFFAARALSGHQLIAYIFCWPDIAVYELSVVASIDAGVWYLRSHLVNRNLLKATPSCILSLCE